MPGNVLPHTMPIAMSDPGGACCSACSADDGPGSADEMPVATFEVAGQETYKIALATPALVEHARQLMEGRRRAASRSAGSFRDDPSVNAPWSWHIDPATLEFADVTTEVCDGLPSYVEDGTLTSDTYCPGLPTSSPSMEPDPP